MSIPVSIDPLGTLGGFIPAGWRRVEFASFPKVKHIHDIPSPAANDILTIKFRIREQTATYQLMGYINSSTSTSSQKRISLQHAERGTAHFRNANFNNYKGIHVGENACVAVFSHEGITVDGAFHSFPRNVFDEDYCDVFSVPSSAFDFFGMELMRDGAVVAELVPYTNGVEYAVADSVNRQFFRI